VRVKARGGIAERNAARKVENAEAPGLKNKRIRYPALERKKVVGLWEEGRGAVIHDKRKDTQRQHGEARVMDGGQGKGDIS